MSNLFISNTRVPYREDFCRALSEAGYRVCHYLEGDVDTCSFLGRTCLKGLDALLVKERPERVIVPEFSGIAMQFAMLRKRFGFKLISLCDDSMDMIAGNDFSRFHRLARRWVPRHLDGMIVPGAAVGGWYAGRFGLKTVPMPLIADERRVRPELERVLPLSERIRPTDKPVVAFVGRFVGLKNIPALIRAFEPLRDRAQLVLIGDGPERDTLREMAPDALFPGMLHGDDLLAWYNLVDILVLPSTQEAYGAVTGEALMAGAKVVVSDRAGSTDLVREGENGYVCPPQDIDGLTGKLADLLQDSAPGRPLTLRPNLLPYSFGACVDNVLRTLENL